MLLFLGCLCGTPVCAGTLFTMARLIHDEVPGEANRVPKRCSTCVQPMSERQHVMVWCHLNRHYEPQVQHAVP
jgi:hypothetical protein